MKWVKIKGNHLKIKWVNITKWGKKFQQNSDYNNIWFWEDLQLIASNGSLNVLYLHLQSIYPLFLKKTNCDS